jgi:hypothetical protein
LASSGAFVSHFGGYRLDEPPSSEISAWCRHAFFGSLPAIAEHKELYGARQAKDRGLIADAAEIHSAGRQSAYVTAVDE